MMRSDYGKIFTLWNEGVAQKWLDNNYYAFLVSMPDGTLLRAVFLHYIIQNWVFLVHFSPA